MADSSLWHLSFLGELVSYALKFQYEPLTLYKISPKTKLWGKFTTRSATSDRLLAVICLVRTYQGDDLKFLDVADSVSMDPVCQTLSLSFFGWVVFLKLNLSWTYTFSPFHKMNLPPWHSKYIVRRSLLALFGRRRCWKKMVKDIFRRIGVKKSHRIQERTIKVVNRWYAWFV